MSLSKVFRLLAAAGVLSALASAPARAVPDPKMAAQVFAEAKAICARDKGPFWGEPLCGPMLLVDFRDRGVAANQANPSGTLKQQGPIWVGVYPEPNIVSATPTEWEDLRWTQILWPMLPGDDQRHVMLAHEMFHRIQPGLGLTRPEAGNQHLDSLEGRYLLQLEWRALAKALTAKTSASRRGAILDALLFRRERYRLFPNAEADEGDLEVNEGVPEYTGVRLGLATPRERLRYALYDLGAYSDAPTLVRSFAYAIGPAYGLLLDKTDPAWRTKLATGPAPDQLLSLAIEAPPPAFDTLKAREAVYDDGALLAHEVQRDHDKQAALAALRARLVDGPVLVLPLHHATYQFRPQDLQPLDQSGTVYPSMTLESDWGVLHVDHGGALLDSKMTVARVSAIGFDTATLKGDGWTLKLKPGWTIQPGARSGDLVAKQTTTDAK